MTIVTEIRYFILSYLALAAFLLGGYAWCAEWRPGPKPFSCAGIEAIFFIGGAVTSAAVVFSLFMFAKQLRELGLAFAEAAAIGSIEPIETRRFTYDELQKMAVAFNQLVEDEKILARSIAEGMVLIDAEGRITYINEIAERILGVRSKDVHGRHYSLVWPIKDSNGGELSPVEKNPVHQAFISGRKVVIPAWECGKDEGRSMPLAVVANPLFFSGAPSGLLVIFRDITKEREIDRAKIEFVSLASHQLRTPLTIVNWCLEMLLGGDAGKIPEAQKKYLREVDQANKRMVNLVNSLLNVSKIDLGTFVIEPVPTDLSSLLNDAFAELLPLIRKKKLRVDTDYEKGLPLVPGDQKLFRVVIQNLLSNAVKYTPAKGKISAQLAKQGNNVLLTVADSGYGIPQHQQPKIFTKLFRADNIKEKETDGNGLGLFIVKSVIESSGGKIWFESKENHGTTFYVLLPFTKSRKRRLSKPNTLGV